MKFRVYKHKSEYDSEILYRIQTKFLWFWYHPEHKILNKYFTSLDRAESAIYEYLEKDRIDVVKYYNM